METIGSLTMLKKYVIITLMTVLGLCMINGCATLPKHFAELLSYAFPDMDSTRFAQPAVVK